MPTGAKGERRPADVIGNAVQVMRIATGREPEETGLADGGNDPAAKALGKKDGAARAANMTPTRSVGVSPHPPTPERLTSNPGLRRRSLASNNSAGLPVG